MLENLKDNTEAVMQYIAKKYKKELNHIRRYRTAIPDKGYEISFSYFTLRAYDIAPMIYIFCKLNIEHPLYYIYSLLDIVYYFDSYIAYEMSSDQKYIIRFLSLVDFLVKKEKENDFTIS